MIAVVNQLMPAGKPDYLGMVKYPKISDLIQVQGEPRILLIISIMIRDFCASFNVVRNMNEDQILESAVMLMTECGNFRLEDYTMMFAMAKKGQLVKIYDRIDIEVITNILDKYWNTRKDAAIQAQESEAGNLDGLGPTMRTMDGKNADEVKMLGMMDGFAGGIGNMREALKEKTNPETLQIPKNGGAGTMEP
jgi:hypothetical protein